MADKDFDFEELLSGTKKSTEDREEQPARATSKQKKPRRKKEVKLDRFTTAMHPDIKEAIQAIAWYDRVSQREVIEKAIQQVFPLDSDRVTKAIKEFKKQN